MNIFNKIITSNSPIKYIPAHNGIRMANHHNPVSISEQELNYIYRFIKRYNLKRGYEVATAFGVSAIGIGLAMKETGGKLVTMDAYIEEQYNHCNMYADKIDVYQESDGLNSVKFLIDLFNLREVVFPTVGWSPTDTIKNISSIFDLKTEKLDFVFIDSMHNDIALMNDIKSIITLLDDKYVIFLHDMGGVYENTTPFIIEYFGKNICRVEETWYHTGHGLAYITNLE